MLSQVLKSLKVFIACSEIKVLGTRTQRSLTEKLAAILELFLMLCLDCIYPKEQQSQRRKTQKSKQI